MRYHRAPWECTLAKEDKSDCKAGVRFEILSLCILQAGLNWRAIRNNWGKIRKGFYNFDIKRLSKARVDELIKRSGVIKNERKIRAIVENAKKFQRIKLRYGSFLNFIHFLKRMGDEEAIQNWLKNSTIWANILQSTSYTAWVILNNLHFFSNFCRKCWNN
jgi:3-methyladenine DNA glycosylase Tag